MVKKSITLDAGTARIIKELAKTQGRSQSAIIREALQEYLKENFPREIPGIGAFRSGRSDVSERVEELLDEAALEWKKKRDEQRDL